MDCTKVNDVGACDYYFLSCARCYTRCRVMRVVVWISVFVGDVNKGLAFPHVLGIFSGIFFFFFFLGGVAVVVVVDNYK